MAWTENPPTDVVAGQEGHPELHNELGRAVIEVQGAVDAIPAGQDGAEGPQGPAGAQGPAGPTGPQGDPGEVTQAEFDDLEARVAALEAG